MSASILELASRQHEERNWVDVAAGLGPALKACAATADEDDRFVAENYERLAECGLLAAGVPAELGGGGADLAEISAVLRELAAHCGSTALACAMHTHQVMVNAWRWRRAGAPVAPLLERVARQGVVLLSSGGADWLHGSGRATRAEGGFVVHARKPFSSAAPAGNLLLTSAVYEDPESGPTVLHFAVAMDSDAVSVEPTWRAMGMRGTGSHDIVIDGLFVPDGAVGGRRPQGRWHPLFHIVSMIAIPLIYSVYVGVAKAARDRALELAARRRIDGHLLQQVGAMENELAAARLGLADMLAAGQLDTPGPAVTSRVFTGRALVERSVLATVEQAMLVGGGAAFYRANGLERLFRDAQGARYHPLPQGVQRELAARVALGLDIDGGNAG